MKNDKKQIELVMRTKYTRKAGFIDLSFAIFLIGIVLVSLFTRIGEKLPTAVWSINDALLGLIPVFGLVVAGIIIRDYFKN